MDIVSGLWEGERSSGGLVRAAIQRMDERFVQAMAAAHADRATPVRKRASIAPPPAVSSAVSARPLSVHDMDLSEADEDVALINSILRRPSVNRIVTSVAERTGVSPYRIASKSRSRDVIAARGWVFFLLSEDGFSLTQIGRMFHKDHTTILHSLRKHKKTTGQ